MDAGDGSIGTGLAFEVPHVMLSVNGVEQSVPASIAVISALRDEPDLTGTKPGCGVGACGSCTVLVDGEPVKACQQKVAVAAGRSVTTIEALASAGRLYRVQQAFAEIGAAQCGHCTPGMTIS
jgi:aerobic-type carbon monoxide dehydrogenase small subunit (CoxS/CutS family)